MFHTLDELKEQENITRNRANTATGTKSGDSNIFKEKTKKNLEPLDNNSKFERTKQKIRLAVYKNGFILNDEIFRDKSIPENKKFLEEVEKGQIPQELVKKGFTDLGILLINHRNEIYNPYQQINYLDLMNMPFNHRTELYQYPQNLQYNYYPQNQYPIDNNININNNINNFYPNDNYGFIQNNNYNNYQKVCYTEKRERKNNNPIDQIKNIKNDEAKDTIKKESKKETKKEIKKEIKTDNRAKSTDKTDDQFKAFTGRGRQVGHVNLKGLTDLKVDKCATPNINRMYPTCKISIRLFNGEVVNTEFNFGHTLRDIYLYVRRVSGYNNFSLLEGFPPTPLRDYDRSIAELKLQNTILTQRIY